VTPVHSAKEAGHVLPAVPFALTGGVFLLKILGYNFSVAVWVGFIALFGTAVQTGVVMVIYLEDDCILSPIAIRNAGNFDGGRKGLNSLCCRGGEHSTQ
jgi:Cu/Ag efflux pump CusA